jgi:hypothetical protein
MSTQYTAIVKQQGQWWTGWIAEIPGVTCQELSRETLMKSLTFALKEALEASRDGAVSAAGEGYEEIIITL